MDTLFDIDEHPQFVNPGWGDMARSLSFDETEILKWIMRLYTEGKAFDLDPTYSIGRLWSGLPQPKMKMDIKPQARGVIRADVRALPIQSASLQSVFFDPPFVIGPVEVPGKIRNRFSAFRTPSDLFDFYAKAIIELHRILKRRGVLVFKCQDTVSGGKQYLSHVHIINRAEAAGFTPEDLFVLGRNNVMWSPNMRNQQHARKTHSYYLILIKR